MRTKLCLCALGLAAGALGCASGKSTFNSAADLRAAPSMGRVFVLARMKNTGFNEQVYAGFDRGMRAGFGNCGIQSETMHVNDMDLDPAKRFQSAKARFNPDAVLFIQQAGGNVVIGQGGTSSDLIMDMQFFDSRTQKPFWHARSQFSLLTRNVYVNDGASGERLARDTIERLRSDGLLKDCREPTAAATSREGPTGEWR
jgi:hypothetical protein